VDSEVKAELRSLGLLVGFAGLLAAAYYASQASRPELFGTTSITGASVEVDAGSCPRQADVHFRDTHGKATLDDPLELDRIAKCLVEGSVDHIELDAVTDVPRAVQVAGALEQRGVPANRLSRVSFANDLPLCPTADRACWSMRRAQMQIAEPPPPP
jgi:hypothetical protein